MNLVGVVYSLVVAHGLRRCGVGRMIMEKLEEEAKVRGLTHVQLSTPDMQLFYEACGYKVA